MSSLPNSFYLTIDFSESELDSEELEKLTQNLFQQVSKLDEVEKVERIRETPPENVKAGASDLGRWLAGCLSTEISLPNVLPAVKFLFSRLTGKKIKFRAKANDKVLELEATGSSQDEILAIIQALQDFAGKA